MRTFKDLGVTFFQGFLIFLLFQVLGSTLYDITKNITFATLANHTIIAIIFLFILKRKNLFKVKRENFTLKDLSLVVLAVIGIQLLLIALLNFFSFPGAKEYIDKVDRIHPLALFISSVILAPISEELAYRGFLYGKLRRVLTGRKGMVLSALITGIIFSLSHLSAIHFVPGVLLTVVLAYFYDKGVGLLPLILIHSTYNFFMYFSDVFYAHGFFIPVVVLCVFTFRERIMGWFW